MLRVLAKRLAWALILLLATSMITFGLIYLVPADPARTVAGPKADPEILAAIRKEMGLDAPLPVRYGLYVWRAAHGDFGRSYITGEKVLAKILDRFPATATLAVGALVVSVGLGILIGVVAAVRRNSLFDRGSLVLSLGALSVPTFVLGMLLLYYLAFRVRIFPLGGRGGLASLVLPAVTLGLGGAAYYSRVVRANMLDVIGQDYVRCALAKGLSRRRVFFRHALRNALLPMFTLVGIDLAGLLGGAVLTETVFGWPGLGKLAVDSIFNLDVPMIMGTVLFAAVLVVLGNLVVDLCYLVLDPRIRLE